jgi:hypothetical protein
LESRKGEIVANLPKFKPEIDSKQKEIFEQLSFWGDNDFPD